jgi:hypothetical protein
LTREKSIKKAFNLALGLTAQFAILIKKTPKIP